MRVWLTNYIESEGLARLTIVLLTLTTVGCLSYTWGYYEGVHNENVIIPMTPSSGHGGHGFVMKRADTSSADSSSGSSSATGGHSSSSGSSGGASTGSDTQQPQAQGAGPQLPDSGGGGGDWPASGSDNGGDEMFTHAGGNYQDEGDEALLQQQHARRRHTRPRKYLVPLDGSPSDVHAASDVGSGVGQQLDAAQAQQLLDQQQQQAPFMDGQVEEGGPDLFAGDEGEEEWAGEDQQLQPQLQPADPLNGGAGAARRYD